ncbi:sigma-54 dependent transcriptional regulator [Variovorax sp. YR752]|uniref:sigma-54 interaction domain-containing protein n=1 Tax=Variovorax sp. YR752 TaxID=1884383 RepID=UPI003137DE2C
MRLQASLGVDVVNFPLAGDPASAPDCDFRLLRLASHGTYAELEATLAELDKFGTPPMLALCDESLLAWAQAIAHSAIPDFLFEPFADEELRARLHRARANAPVLFELSSQMTAAQRLARNLIGGSPAFVAQIERLNRYAKCDATVLILGETGTGKEIFARALHYTSARAADPWVAINCGAIPHDLVEDELFGHVRGAYTTAHAQRNGLVKEAEGGSLFLDDVDCLPLPAQAKLLRFLQEREFRPVGSNALLHADVRVIAASNRDLGRLAERGEFRQDLFFRLNVLPLALPPLRERLEDIATLSQHFVRHFAREFKCPVDGLTPRALNRLLAYDWPGNVRELQHVIERATVLARQTRLDADDLDCGRPDAALLDGSFRSLKARVVEDFERGYIAQLLGANEGNVTHAALAAGKNRRAFFELMRKYRIASDDFRSPLD